MYGSTTTMIRWELSHISPAEIFTTRDLLQCGSRYSIDKALQRMVKDAEIFRLVNGVFIQQRREVTIEEIVRVKARSFKKTAITHPRENLARMKLGKTPKSRVFATEGATSSFLFRVTNERVYVKKTCPRKMSLGDSKAGKAMRALWHLGKRKCRANPNAVATATSRLNRLDRNEIYQSTAALPEWLNHMLNSARLGRVGERPRLGTGIRRIALGVVPEVHERQALYQLDHQPSLMGGIVSESQPVAYLQEAIAFKSKRARHLSPQSGFS